MEERCNKQENVRDYLRENLELIERIKTITVDDLRIIAGDIHAMESCDENPCNLEKNVLELAQIQNCKLEMILSTLEETRSKLIG